MATVQITINGGPEIEAKLRKLGPSIHQLGEAFRVMGDHFANYYAGQVFSSQGQVYGERWAPLAASTLRQKTQGIKGGKGRAGSSASAILVGTGEHGGHMQDQFRTEGGDDWMRVYNSATYFKYHQEGTSKMPQRIMIDLNEALKKRAVSDVKAEIQRKLDTL